MIGQSVSHYSILEKLGEGGMGVVYKAHDTTLDRDVALKFLPPYLTSDATEKERFYHEARAAAALTHNNIAVVYEIGEHDKQVFIAMEYVEGKTLKQLVQAEPLSMKKVLDISVQVCEGLSAAHEKGIVHRDIKSDNIIVTPKGQPKITDFGLAKVKGATKLTKAGSTLGTAAYMSPEQAQGEEVDQRSDLFSFGVVLYELLTGRLPFRGEHHAALIYSIVNEQPAPVARFNENVTPELDHIVMKALAKDTEERYQHADDMLADLRSERKKMEYAKSGYIRAGEVAVSQTSQQPTVTPPAPKWRRKGAMIGVAAILLIVIVAIIFNPFNFQITTQKSVASVQNSLAVMYFQNIPDPADRDHTGEMLADLLITSLSQTRGLEVISRERLFDIQKELKTDSKSITPDMATEIARRAGVTTMLLGSVLQTEPQLAVTTRLIDVKSGRILNSQRVTGFSARQIFQLVDTLALLVRNDLNILVAASAPVKSVAEVTASSPEAYRSYAEGVELNTKYFTADAKAAFKRAIELDSNFAMAYFGLATLNLSTDDVERRGALEKAWQLRNKAAERDRLRIETLYAREIEDDPVKAARIGESIIERYPHEQAVYLTLSGAYFNMGDGEKARQAVLRGLQYDSLDKTLWNLLAYGYAGRNQRREAFQSNNKYMELAPGEPNPYDSRGELYAIFGELDSAEYWLKKSLSFRSDFGSSSTLGHIALLRQDYAAADLYYQQYGSTSEQASRIDPENIRLFISLHKGQLNAVRGKLIAKISALKDQHLEAFLGGTYHLLALISAEVGDYPGMVKCAQQLWQLRVEQNEAGPFERGVLAWAFARSGNMQMASQLMEEFRSKINMSVVQTQATYDYTAALVAYEEGKYGLAVDQFNKAFQHLFPNHAPQLVYAISLLKSGHAPEAIRELQRATWWVHISFPPINLQFLPRAGSFAFNSVKAHYWLGVAYEQAGRKKDAIGEYEKFLDIWKDADFKSPEMQDARARLAKLKGAA